MSVIIARLASEDDGTDATWELRRDDDLVGTARTQRRPRGHALDALDVTLDDAPAALAAMGVALRARSGGAGGRRTHR